MLTTNCKCIGALRHVTTNGYKYALRHLIHVTINCKCNIHNVASSWNHHNLWNKQSDTPIHRQSAISIHWNADKRLSPRIISYKLGTKEAFMVVSCSTTNTEILFKFLLKEILSICTKQKNKWSFLAFGSDMQLGYHLNSSQSWS